MAEEVKQPGTDAKPDSGQTEEVAAQPEAPVRPTNLHDRLEAVEKFIENLDVSQAGELLQRLDGIEKDITALKKQVFGGK